ncbi:MAG: glycosyltransferase family 2 protein [Marinicaulis sp.]|nr:glycosyltransferase family 2 protein [Marinicaulis sp.]NNE40573.1 glycosyltransferase family 2 protein [Marinicaulis sp.]NNL90182.1 glycosyltransferase family 2 protein [Marinicaulis sp.]
MSIGAVIVNYNTGALAIDAALSILGDVPSVKIVIVDNASIDDSISVLRSAFSGEVDHVPLAPTNAPSPVGFAALPTISAEFLEEDCEPSGKNITVIQARRNHGFGAGCNIGLRFLQRRFNPNIFLLLNPDALLATGAINAFRSRLADREAGLCGASILRFENPQETQAFGGASLNRLTLLGKNIGAGPASDQLPTRNLVESNLSYPLGAAIAFRKDFLEHAGFFDENYFLYYEEADLVRRGAPAFRPVWAPEAIVYHRHGASAGSRRKQGGRSVLADFHMARSRMLYARKWRPILTPLLLLLSCGQACRRILRGHWRQAGAIMRGAFGAVAP